MKKCGFIAIVGRPNVGKSTLLNHILQYKVSITCRKPQTTRHQIMGIKTVEDTQFIYVDTPGMQLDTPKALNRFMNKAAMGVINDVDLVLFIVEVGKWTELDRWILEKLKTFEVPVVLVINKVDQLRHDQETIDFIAKMEAAHTYDRVFVVSAKQGHSVKDLEAFIEEKLPESEYFYYGADQVTDKSERFMVAEIIREKLMRSVGQEVPYQLTVEIEDFKVDEKHNKVKIHAAILVERDSQKGIVIGAKGARLKKIGTDARADLEKMLGKSVNIQLWVKVKEGWSDDDRALKSLGYDLL